MGSDKRCDGGAVRLSRRGRGPAAFLAVLTAPGLTVLTLTQGRGRGTGDVVMVTGPCVSPHVHVVGQKPRPCEAWVKRDPRVMGSPWTQRGSSRSIKDSSAPGGITGPSWGSGDSSVPVGITGSAVGQREGGKERQEGQSGVSGDLLGTIEDRRGSGDPPRKAAIPAGQWGQLRSRWDNGTPCGAQGRRRQGPSGGRRGCLGTVGTARGQWGVGIAAESAVTAGIGRQREQQRPGSRGDSRAPGGVPVTPVGQQGPGGAEGTRRGGGHGRERLGRCRGGGNSANSRDSDRTAASRQDTATRRAEGR